MASPDEMADARPSPQAPCGLVVEVPESFRWPPIDPVSPLAVRGKAHEMFCLRACHSSRESVERFLLGMASGEAETTGRYPGLSDELSAYLSTVPRIDRDQSTARTLREFAVYARMRKAAESIAHTGPGDFADLLLEVHRRLGTGANAFRAGPVGTRPDGAGNQVVYPDHRRCLPLIRALHSFLCLNMDRYPAVCAMAAYVGINQAHPFADGNGRTARTAYNLIVAASGSRHFLPLYGFNTARGGSLIIKVRRAMYGGDWAPLLAFLADATRLSDRLQRDRAHHRDTRPTGTLPSPIN